MTTTRRLVVALTVAATIVALAAAFLTARSLLYLLAALAAIATLVAWRGVGSR
jgi:hypothetical protein